MQIGIGPPVAYMKDKEKSSSIYIPEGGNAVMYLMFAPALAALVTISAIQLRDQFAKLT
jgi:hypothetical protein